MTLMILIIDAGFDLKTGIYMVLIGAVSKPKSHMAVKYVPVLTSKLAP
jgi:hypothetical protein